MNLNDEKIMEILKFVNESDYGYLNLEVEGVQISAIKRNMDLANLSNVIGTNNSSSNQLPNSQVDTVSVNNSKVDVETQKVENETDSKVYESKVEKDHTKQPGKNEYIVKSPMLGTFFRRPSPEEPEYAVEGDKVDETDTICLIEVMKLFNSVPAERNGKVIEFLVNDGDLVEYNQPICIIELDR